MGNEFSGPVPALPVLRLGGLASSCLASGSRGTVLASTSRAIYLLADSQELLWIADGRSSLHRRCAQVAGLIPNVAPGADWVVDGTRLEVGGRAAFDLSNASAWGLSPAGLRRAASPAHMISHLVGAISWLTRLCTPEGFGVLLPGLLDLAGQRLPPAAIVELGPAASRAWPAIRDIYDCCLGRDHRAALRRAAELVGLGEGLTPSGDDFVGALLYSLARLPQADPGLGTLDASVVEEFLRTAKRRTNTISYSLLADLAHGHASDSIKRFVDALLTGQDSERVRRRAALLIRAGHSTGWDLLSGVAFAILATASAYESGRRAEIHDARLLQV